MQRSGGWKNSIACVVSGAMFVLATMLLITLYDSTISTTNVILKRHSFMPDKMSTCNALDEVLDSTCVPLSCNSPGKRMGSPNSIRGAGYTDVEAISLEEAFFEKMHTLDVSQAQEKLTVEEMNGFKTRFLPNDNYLQFPLLTMENVCMDPTGALVLIDTTQGEIQNNMSGPGSIPELYYTWNEIYACNGDVSSDHCVGVMFAPSLLGNHTIIRGTTAHMLPYIGNSMHNWAERTWPFVMAASPPINLTIPYPINNYIIHRFDKWLFESTYENDRAQLLWQFRMAMELSGSLNPTYILVKNQSNLACFERLLLQQHAQERIDQTRVPAEIAGPAVKKYRDAIFEFFALQKPEVRLPPQKLRVLYYGRNDTTRRRVTNHNEVVEFLQNFSRPPLEVHVLDVMLTLGETNYTFPEVIRLFSQTDLLVIAHGANTWATFLLPEGAGVVEIFGPCNWGGFNVVDLRVMHTWMHVNAGAAKLKHDISNPFKEAIPNPMRGNTTECKDPFSGVPDYTIDTLKLGQIINSFAFPDWPCDHLTQHWLYDWDS